MLVAGGWAHAAAWWLAGCLGLTLLEAPLIRAVWLSRGPRLAKTGCLGCVPHVPCCPCCAAADAGPSPAAADPRQRLSVQQVLLHPWCTRGMQPGMLHFNDQLILSSQRDPPSPQASEPLGPGLVSRTNRLAAWGPGAGAGGGGQAVPALGWRAAMGRGECLPQAATCQLGSPDHSRAASHPSHTHCRTACLSRSLLPPLCRCWLRSGRSFKRHRRRRRRRQRWRPGSSSSSMGSTGRARGKVRAPTATHGMAAAVLCIKASSGCWGSCAVGPPAPLVPHHPEHSLAAPPTALCLVGPAGPGNSIDDSGAWLEDIIDTRQSPSPGMQPMQ